MEKRPADTIGLAVMIGKIATGEVGDERESLSSAPAEMDRKGGKACAESMSPEQRAEITKGAAAKQRLTNKLHFRIWLRSRTRTHTRIEIA